MNEAPNPLTTQIAGSHYKSKAIQPIEYIEANKLSFLEGCIVKRITRWREKDGINDLLKIKHEVDLIIEFYEREMKETETRFTEVLEQAKKRVANTPSKPIKPIKRRTTRSANKADRSA